MDSLTKNANETEEMGRKMGSALKGGEILFLKGELGAGKTTFVQGLAKGLGVESVITSPTFILMRSYRLPEEEGRSAKTLYHVDLYRLEEHVDFEAENLGIFDLWGKPDSIFVIEWADRLNRVPRGATEVSIEILEADTRKIITKQLLG